MNKVPTDSEALLAYRLCGLSVANLISHKINTCGLN